MAEMLRNRHQALFRGETEEEQLDCIFVIMGTPTEETWPGVSQFPEYPKFEANWKIHAPQQLDKHVPRLDRNGLDLLERMLELRPEKRITASEALEHSWLAEIKRTQDGSLALTSSERAQVSRG
jgi:non-specific serine/threonine protein kinase